jgi:hypothetical protein
VRRPALVALVAALAAAVGATPAAAACSREGSSGLQRRLAAADGALVGWLTERHGSVLTFRVQVRVKGVKHDHVRVHVPRGCRPAVRRGRRTGLLLDRRHGRWEADAFDVVDPVALLKTAGIGP